MKRNSERDRELRLQLVESNTPRARRVWLPGAHFAEHQLDTRHWRRDPAAGLDWQRAPSWLARQRLN